MSPFFNNTTVVFNSTVDSAQWLFQFSLWSLRIVCPLFIFLCPVLNYICIRIFQSRTYARASSKWYFIFIAIFDTIYVLVTAPLLFLITMEVYILNWNIILCKSIVFLNYLSCQISAGLLACLSIDRLIATSCLLFYRHTCTTNLSKIVCLIVIIALSIVNSHYLIGYTIDSNGYCSTRYYKWYEANYSSLNIVYLLSYSIIPFTIITICNIFIVFSVCQNKKNMKKKYDSKRSTIQSNSYQERSLTSKDVLNVWDKSKNTLQFKIGSEKKTSLKNDSQSTSNSVDNGKRINNIRDSTKWDSQQINRFSETPVLNENEPINTCERISTDNKLSHESTQLDRSLLTNLVASSANPQKIGVQLQITISLLVISICFILCTLPNCLTTIMIQAYTYDEKVRKFWQTMNYFSIIPLLTTHSVNLIFYYLSSNMFRERFKEYIFKNRT